MTKPLEIVKVGNAFGVVIPEDILARLRLELGDKLFVTEGPGNFTLSPADTGFEEQMTAAREVMSRRRNALRELAK